MDTVRENYDRNSTFEQIYGASNSGRNNIRTQYNYYYYYYTRVLGIAKYVIKSPSYFIKP